MSRCTWCEAASRSPAWSPRRDEHDARPRRARRPGRWLQLWPVLVLFDIALAEKPGDFLETSMRNSTKMKPPK
jgi:hypothetical protein